jgi:hypothetical protein
MQYRRKVVRIRDEVESGPIESAETLRFNAFRVVRYLGPNFARDFEETDNRSTYVIRGMCSDIHAVCAFISGLSRMLIVRD